MALGDASADEIAGRGAGLFIVFCELAAIYRDMVNFALGGGSG